MATLTKGRKTSRFAGGGMRDLPVAADAICQQGGIAIVSGGFVRAGRVGQGADNAARAADAATYRAAGIFEYGAIGGASNGDVRTDVQQGTFGFVSAPGADAVTAAHVGLPCYIVDDQTVGITNPNSIRAYAGVVQAVDDQVWVDMSLTISATLVA